MVNKLHYFGGPCTSTIFRHDIQSQSLYLDDSFCSLHRPREVRGKDRVKLNFCERLSGRGCLELAGGVEGPVGLALDDVIAVGGRLAAYKRMQGIY
jgi:hypothetical protein